MMKLKNHLKWRMRIVLSEKLLHTIYSHIRDDSHHVLLSLSSCFSGVSDDGFLGHIS